MPRNPEIAFPRYPHLHSNMAAIDLLFRTGLESERLHQLALVSLLRHTTLPGLLVPDFGLACTIEWEPRGGTYDLSMTNAAGITVMLELKVDAALGHRQIGKQLDALEADEHLAYVLLGYTRLTARPRLDQRLGSPKSRCSVHDLHDLLTALERVEIAERSQEASDARDLASAYRRQLPALASRSEGFFDHPVAKWNGELWGCYFGYFDHCRRTLPGMQDAGISYVPNPTGGFRALYFHGVDVEPGVEAYLQFENDCLCFKISVGDEIERSSTRDRIRQHLHEIVDALDLPIQRPARLGSGQTMTLAFLDPEQTGFGVRSQQDHFARVVTTAMDSVSQLGQPQT